MKEDIIEILFSRPIDDRQDAEDTANEILALFNVSYWVAFDWDKPETRPTKCGKYFVHRKDGKVHWETWNGSGWAYNGNVITCWMEVKPPCS